MYCVETKHLFHSFSGQRHMLKDINLRVPTGVIYGFLGANGAGKTTTLRILLGLISKQQGEVIFFGKIFKKNRIEILKATGVLIESPSLYSHLTARENLLLLQKVFQCSKNRIQEVLKIVGLSETGDKKVDHFSLGMKQRLSIAVALLHNPKLLILDEPTNGLDPNGIIEIRELLKKLNEEQGITIIISSHLLSEIERLVTHIGILNHGSLVFQGTLQDLVSQQNESDKIILETSDIGKSLSVIELFHLNAKVNDGKILLPMLSKNVIAKLNNQLVQEGIEVFEISTSKKDLETIFMELIKD